MTEQTARKPEQIEAEIAQARDALASTIDTLENRLRPANLIQAAKDKAIGVVRRRDGSIDPRRAAIVAGAGLILVTYFIRRRKL